MWNIPLFYSSYIPRDLVKWVLSFLGQNVITVKRTKTTFDFHTNSSDHPAERLRNLDYTLLFTKFAIHSSKLNKEYIKLKPFVPSFLFIHNKTPRSHIDTKDRNLSNTTTSVNLIPIERLICFAFNTRFS